MTPVILVFGSVNVDFVARVEAIARPGETVLSPVCTTLFGGKGANQAVAAAAATGLPVRMVAAVGPDAYGAECVANLRDRGIGTAAIQRHDRLTGMAFIAVDRQGENAITVASGANMQISAAAVPEAEFATARVCLLQMEVPLPETLAAAARARAAGARVILNFAPAMPDVPAAALDRLLDLCDVLVLNRHEAATLLAMLAGRIADAAGLARAFDLDVITTLGADGVDYVDRAGLAGHLPAVPVTVLDTTGAGDTFVGVLAAGLAEGAGLAAAIAGAAARASVACTWPGAQPPHPAARV